MQKVSNKTCIRRLSRRSLKAARARNIIAIFAIVLTAVMFTAVFTIALSMNKSFQEQNFRQAGGNFHGSFKNVTEEQKEQLKGDPMIQEAGGRLLVGMPEKSPFLKSHVEVGYSDETCASAMYCIPTEGRLPKEGTMEAATDTRVLALLGVEPKIGATFTITYRMGKYLGDQVQEVTSTFTLCGYWEYDEAGSASHVLVPESYAKEQLASYASQGEQDNTGTWDLYVNFKSSMHIQEDLNQVLENQGYQSTDQTQDNYIATGVNWGYTGAQMSNNMDAGTLAGIAGAMALIIFTGYLIIYNIFRISVTGDIRFYGLLKTVGTTGKQIRSMIRRQALLLCVIGIPVGLLAGWIIGGLLVPVVTSSMSGVKGEISINPVIFVGAGLFSLATVFLSVSKPGRIAGKVSPVEAVRYTEQDAGRKKRKKGEKGGKTYRMAFANLGRNKSKTVLILLSLSLAVVMLNVTYTFTNGFDMDKYLEKWVSTDFVVGHAKYFQNSFYSEDEELPEEIIAQIEKEEGITGSGRIYGQVSTIVEYVTEEAYRALRKNWPDDIDELVKNETRNEEGLLQDQAQVYGMEEFPLTKAETLEGDLSKLTDGSGDYIAAIVEKDDYDDPIDDSQHWQVGDQMTLSYIDETRLIDTRTGEEAADDTPEEYIELEITKSHEKTYTVCARVTIRNSMSYRHYGRESFILPAEEFIKQTGTDSVMTYVFDTTNEANDRMEAFLKDYTENVQVEYDYESKQSYADQFNGFRNMFLLMGSLLSFAIGLIGILNFINGVMTGIISRKREFAVLQAVGMTGRQLKQMLAIEGCLYGIGAILLALAINALMSPLIGRLLGQMFWFFSYRFTVAPILIMLPVFLIFGVGISIAALRALAAQSVVDRIRNAD